MTKELTHQHDAESPLGDCQACGVKEADVYNSEHELYLCSGCQDEYEQEQN